MLACMPEAACDPEVSNPLRAKQPLQGACGPTILAAGLGNAPPPRSPACCPACLPRLPCTPQLLSGSGLACRCFNDFLKSCDASSMRPSYASGGGRDIGTSGDAQASERCRPWQALAAPRDAHQTLGCRTKVGQRERQGAKGQARDARAQRKAPAARRVRLKPRGAPPRRGAVGRASVARLGLLLAHAAHQLLQRRRLAELAAPDPRHDLAFG